MLVVKKMVVMTVVELSVVENGGSGDDVENGGGGDGPKNGGRPRAGLPSIRGATVVISRCS